MKNSTEQRASTAKNITSHKELRRAFGNIAEKSGRVFKMSVKVSYEVGWKFIQFYIYTS